MPSAVGDVSRKKSTDRALAAVFGYSTPLHGPRQGEIPPRQPEGARYNHGELAACDGCGRGYCGNLNRDMNRMPSIRRLVNCGWIALAVVCMAFASFGAVAPRPAAPSETAIQAEHLIAELSSDSWQIRQAAQDGLIRLGPEVRPRLKDVVRQTDDEEVRTRAEAALQQIEENVKTGPSLITIHATGASPKLIFTALSQQGFTDLRPNPPGLWESRQWPTINLNVDRAPFWTVMKQVCTRFGVSPQNMGTSGEMSIVEGGNIPGRSWNEAPSVVSGPFLIVATSISRTNYVDLNQPRNVRRNCNVQLMVFVEPKLRVLMGPYNARIDEATDERGNSLIMPGVGYENLQPATNGIWNLSAALQTQADSGDRLVKLRGSARFVLQTRSETMEIPDILKARDVTRSVGERRFQLREVTRSGSNFVVRMTIYRAGWSPAEWANLYRNSTIKLLDASDRMLARVGGAPGGGTADQMDMTFQFQARATDGQPTGEPVKLAWEVPLETREVAVPFEFTDLTLP